MSTYVYIYKILLTQFSCPVTLLSRIVQDDVTLKWFDVVLDNLDKYWIREFLIVFMFYDGING